MNKLFMLGAMVGIGIGIDKLMKKNKKQEAVSEAQSQA